jgi:glycosyltransferase involved in cell wall biosynthesis
MQTKVILLSEIISPYRIPVFNAVAESLGNQFLVLFFGESEKRRHWRVYKEKIKFRYAVLPHLLFQKQDSSPLFFNPTIFFRLTKYSPRILIIGGYHHPSCLLAILYAKIFRKKVILWCESTKYEQRFNHALKIIYKKWFINNCDGYIVPGRASWEYLVSLGARKENISVAPNAVDNDFFTGACEKYKTNREVFKASKGYPEKLVIYVGRLIDSKGIPDLLNAFKMLSHKQSDIGLLIVGSGKQQERYKHFCKINNLNNVFFEGFVHQEDIPAYYTVSDCLVLPTHSDPWGLVLNEAMACSLPVISSDVAGAVRDLIINGENGYIFKKGNIQELTDYLDDILSDEQKRIRMGERSRDIIKGYSVLKCAQGFVRATQDLKKQPDLV